MFLGTIFVPNEKGELTALDAPVNSMPPLPPGDFGAVLGKTLLTLFALVALLGVTFWFLRRLVQQRLQKGDANLSIQVLEKRMISPKTMLYLVEIEGKRVLLAESQLEVRKIETLEKV